MTSPYEVLARITSNRRPPEPAGERCEMCNELIADEHQHVVNVAGRQLMCVCRGCYLLFTCLLYTSPVSARTGAGMGAWFGWLRRFTQGLDD